MVDPQPVKKRATRKKVAPKVADVTVPTLESLAKRVTELENRQDLLQRVVKQLAAVKSWWPEYRNKFK